MRATEKSFSMTLGNSSRFNNTSFTCHNAQLIDNSVSFSVSLWLLSSHKLSSAQMFVVDSAERSRGAAKGNLPGA